MDFQSFLESPPPSWHTWAIPAAGLFAALLALLTGRFVLAHWRARVRPVAEASVDDGPIHDPFEHGSVTERRGTRRRQGNPIEVLIGGPDSDREPVRGWVVDRSMGGLCLLLHEEATPGTVLSLKPRNGPPATPWVQVQVRSCKRDRSGYEAGCQFVRTPPWAVLLLFG
jgi:hypothetical protein